MADQVDNDLKERLNSFIADILSGRGSNPAKFNELQNELERVTGQRAKNYDEIRQEYRDHLEQDVQKVQDDFKKERISQLLDNCEVNANWEFCNIDITSCDESYRKGVWVAHDWIQDFTRYEQGLRIVYEDGHEARFSPGGLFIIYGGFGVGKSMLAGAMARKIIREQQREVVFMQWHTIFNEIQRLRDDSQESYNFEDKIRNVDLLIIDEVAVNKVDLTEAQRRELGELLRARKNQHKNTVIVTNSNPKELYYNVGQFCWESIKNYAPYTVINLGNNNRRPTVVDGFNDLIEQAHMQVNGGRSSMNSGMNNSGNMPNRSAVNNVPRPNGPKTNGNPMSNGNMNNGPMPAKMVPPDRRNGGF